MRRRLLWLPLSVGAIGISVAPFAVLSAMIASPQSQSTRSPLAASAPVASAPAWTTTAGPACTSRAVVADRASSWAAPLDRIVSINLPDASVREALDHIARVAKIELSYSNELLPNADRVCLTFDRVAVGAIFETLLAETSLRAVVIGSAQVVLAPSRPVTPEIAATTPEIRRTSVLDRVVVTGTPDGASLRGSPFALEVIDGATLARQHATTLGDALDLAVPGVWMWSASAGSLTARYGSVRGASSFGASAPKIYLDGIEVANPLLVTQIDPSRVERVEVIRGPQGAALYGADAISGVVNILTRHDGSESGNTTKQFSSVAGMAATSYAPRDAFVQEHMASVRGGSGHRTYGLGVNLGTVGAYVPGASERRLLADGDARIVFDNAVITGTGRLSLQKANASSALVFGDVNPNFSMTSRLNVIGTGTTSADSGVMPRHDLDTTRFVGDSAIGQTITQYTLGATATMMPSMRWTHTIIAGVDGYRLKGLSTTGLPTPTIYGSTLSSGQGGADRATLRARAVGRYDLSDRSMMSLTFAAEQAFTRELVDVQRYGTYVNVANANFGPKAAALLRDDGSNVQTTLQWGNSGGMTAQANYEWNQSIYLVAGVRAERSVGFTALPQNATLPLVGAAYVRDVNGVVVKLRSAYGKGIRPATSLTHAASWMGRLISNANHTLAPEAQTGTELGFDVLMGRALTFRVTRFDQEATGLIQPVAGTTKFTTATGRTANAITYSLENVGAIDNRGWEVQASTGFHKLSVAGSLSLVDSRVKRLAADYSGDLRLGDRMLDVPARTYGLSVMYTANRWNASTMLTRAEDWMGYDRLQIGDDLMDTTRDQPLDGNNLRNYWTNYSGVTRWRANMTYRIIGDWSMLFGGENLLNVQRGAPDNATVTAGRTITLGLRSGF